MSITNGKNIYVICMIRSSTRDIKLIVIPGSEIWFELESSPTIVFSVVGHQKYRFNIYFNKEIYLKVYA